MQLHQLPKTTRAKKRRGRGIAGRGAKSGRGMKGQRSRAGAPRNRAGFEGGQTPLYMRLPKGRGTKQRFASQVVKPIAITTSMLNQFAEGTVVGPGQLRKAGFLKRRADTVKLIQSGALQKKLTIRVHAATERATTTVIKAGGKLELITK